MALANKMARIAWALMTRKEVYQAKGRACGRSSVTFSRWIVGDERKLN